MTNVEDIAKDLRLSPLAGLEMEVRLCRVYPDERIVVVVAGQLSAECIKYLASHPGLIRISSGEWGKIWITFRR